MLPFWQKLFSVTTLFVCNQSIKGKQGYVAILAEPFSVLAEQLCFLRCP